MKYYFYKMTADNGGAPCCTFGRSPLWSLAICKPRIRTAANEGDIIIGFAGTSLDPNAGYGIVHVARVSKSISGQNYYARDSEHRGRDDCIYECRNGEFRLRNRRFHDESDMDRDLGAPPGRRSAQVLLSTEFRYFGKLRVEIDWLKYPALRKVLERLRQGHRVNHDPEVRPEVEALARVAFQPAMSPNRPHDRSGRCGPGDDDDEGSC